MNPDNITFNSHKNHNPDCDILCYQLDKDTTITYGVYVKPAIRWKGPVGYPIQIGTEFMEVYVGENYNVDSTKRSHSRCYYNDGDTKVPAKYHKLWQDLKTHYNNLSTIEVVANKFK
jgi:hypothetical protein